MSEKYVLILNADQRDLVIEALSLRMQMQTATPIVEVSRDDLTRLLDEDARHYRFAIDGGLKVSADRQMWSLPVGTTSDPEPLRVVQAGSLRRALVDMKPEGASALLTETVR